MNNGCGCGPIQSMNGFGATPQMAAMRGLGAGPRMEHYAAQKGYGSTLLWIGLGAVAIGGGFYWYMSK